MGEKFVELGRLRVPLAQLVKLGSHTSNCWDLGQGWPAREEVLVTLVLLVHLVSLVARVIFLVPLSPKF